MPLKRAVTEFGKTYKDRFALRTYPGTSVPIFIFILGWSRTKPRVTLSAQTMHYKSCLRKEHTKGEKWASFFENEDIPDTMQINKVATK